ncbi:MAG: hypothetical protein IIC06_09185 [Proteobacteria bacterium]|nr:hypothetical protein [Pseudomonadota bacterium]
MYKSAQAHRFPLSLSFPAVSLLLAVFLLLGACAPRAVVPTSGATGAGAGKAQKGQSSQTQFGDIPVPKGRKINVDKTVVVGSQVWFGQLTYDTSHGAAAMFDFYGRELPSYGWRKITSVRAQTSFMTYDRGNRVMTIAIQENRIRGSEVTITVSPREETRPPAPQGAVIPGAVMPAAPPPVRGAFPIMPPPVQRR